MTNKARGDTEVSINGKAYVLRPTFGALSMIEAETGLSLIEIVNDFARGSGKLHVMTSIVCSCAIDPATEKATSPAKVIVGCSTVSGADEGHVLKVASLAGLAIVLIIGLLVWALVAFTSAS